MSGIVETIEGKSGLKLEIRYDEFPPNPRVDYDNLGTMVCRHKKYSFGDVNTESEVQKVMSEINSANALIIPIYMYEHGGIAFKASPFSDTWDSGQLGIMYVSHEKIIHEYGSLSEHSLERAQKVMIGELEDYSKYVNGEIYEYRVLNDDDEELDSERGFFDIDDAKEEGMASLAGFEKEYEENFVFKTSRM